MGAEKPRREWWRRELHRIMSVRPVSQIAAKTMHHVDSMVYRLSNGRFTAVSFVGGLPVITLTTTGAKSGLKRSLPLIGVPNGDNIILIASNWGQKRHPSWYHNLRSNPEAVVAIGGTEQTYTARQVTGAEYDVCWSKAVELYAGYEAYKVRTGGREIPIFVLTPT